VLLTWPVVLRVKMTRQTEVGRCASRLGMAIVQYRLFA
jgi:hypothetical protein